MLLIITTSLALYITVSALLWLRALERAPPWLTKTLTSTTTIRTLTTLAAGLHALQLYRNFATDAGINLALGNIISLVTLMTVLLFITASLLRPILTLGLVVLPSALLGLLIGWLTPGQPNLLADLPHGIARHIAIAIPAYAILAIAFAQALLLWLQEHRLRQPNPGRFFPALPPLESMESTLFQLTLLGFALLTINLITGTINTHRLHGTPLLFNHHTLLSIMAWAGFGALLLGRLLFGWRGRHAAKCTTAAFAILALAYFGTRFVTEVIL